MFLELQRKSLVFPDLATNSGPLTSFEKLKLAANNTVSLSSVGAAVIGSAYSQAINSPSGWGQGWDAYGQRFGADMARVASYNFFGNYVIASLTHEDPRFYVRKDLNFGQSVEYAAKRLISTRSDSGEEVVNYAGILGPLAGEGLANVYYPAGNRGFGSTMIRYSTDVGWRFAGYLLRQYWPTINRKLQTASEPETNDRDQAWPKPGRQRTIRGFLRRCYMRESPRIGFRRLRRLERGDLPCPIM